MNINIWSFRLKARLVSALKYFAYWKLTFNCSAWGYTIIIFIKRISEYLYFPRNAASLNESLDLLSCHILMKFWALLFWFFRLTDIIVVVIHIAASANKTICPSNFLQLLYLTPLLLFSRLLYCNHPTTVMQVKIISAEISGKMLQQVGARLIINGFGKI